MAQVHRSLLLFIRVVVTEPVAFREGYELAHLGSLISYLLPFLVNIDLCTLSYSKLQEDTFHLEKLVEKIFHISYGVRHEASVLLNHTDVDEGSYVSESMFERYSLWNLSLAQCYPENSQNTACQIPYLVPLPLRNIVVSFFGYEKSR